MGWTIDVPVTPREDFDAVLDRKLALLREAPAAASALVGWPAGTLDMHPGEQVNPEAAEDDEDWEKYRWDRGTVRPEVLAQVEQAIATAKTQAAALAEPCVSASLVGHVQHPTLTGSEPTIEPHVDVEGHEPATTETQEAGQ